MGRIVIENEEMGVEIGLDPLRVAVVRSRRGGGGVVAAPAVARDAGGVWEILDRSPVSARLGLRRAGAAGLEVIVRYEVDGGELRCEVQRGG